MKLVLFIISLLVCGNYTQVLLAQSGDTTAKDVSELEEVKEPSAVIAEPANASKKPAPPAKPKPNPPGSSSNNKASSKVFIPTEEISEDRPVAFPVDI